MDGLKPTAGVVPSGSVRPRGRPFPPGVSGNPKGRPKGSRNKTTLIAEALRSGEAEALTRKIVERAMHGDAVALRICLERLLPRRRDRCVEFELPELAAGDVAEAARAVLAACAAGTLSPREATDVMGLVATHVRALEVSELRAKRTELERQQQACTPAALAHR
jgi:hypothetical protein